MKLSMSLTIILYSNEEFFPSGALSSPDFARIVNSHHVKRIQGLIARTQGTVVFGSAEECDAEKRFVPPTLVSDVKKADSLMSECVSLFNGACSWSDI
jgi:aldehyde dehydrogenase (NAD+)